MRGYTDEELFDRSLATLVESWAYLASGSPGATVEEVDGIVIAAFAAPPEREFLNNAVLPRGRRRIGAALEGLERVYAERGIERYAIWVHESDEATAAEVAGRGYALDTTTRTMAMPVAALGEVDSSSLDLFEPGLEEFWRAVGVAGMVPELSRGEGHFYVARLDGESVSTLMAFDHEGDCGIYMVGTLPAARRRGIATALSAHAVEEARSRGCATVSLQSTRIAEGVYARVGFRDLGRFREYLPVVRDGAS